MGLINEYVSFLKKERKYWLIPLMVILFFLGALIVFFEGSPLAYFVYALF